MVDLETVQALKERMVMAIMGSGDVLEAKEEAVKFLTQNWIQVLDVLDDALYAHQQGRL